MFQRHADNPLIEAGTLGWPVNSVFNPGAAIGPEGEVVLLLRVEDLRGFSAIHVARSRDGRTGWSVAPEPLLAPEPDQLTAQWGYEDARVVWVPDLGRYVITCTAYGAPGPCVFLGTTTDFASIEERSVILPPEDKNAALFPRRIGGQWLLLHRPVVMARGAADIWISFSNDLWGWRQPQPVMLRRDGGWWDGARIGIGPPPIETEHGWLVLYHGVRLTMSGAIYRMGAAMLDLEQPWQVTHRVDEWLLGPEEPYERVGDVPNVVFPCGAVVVAAPPQADGDAREGRAREGRARKAGVHGRGTRVDVYYGAADSTVCCASASLDALVHCVLSQPSQH